MRKYDYTLKGINDVQLTRFIPKLYNNKFNKYNIIYSHVKIPNLFTGSKFIIKMLFYARLY